MVIYDYMTKSMSIIWLIWLISPVILFDACSLADGGYAHLRDVEVQAQEPPRFKLKALLKALLYPSLTIKL